LPPHEAKAEVANERLRPVLETGNICWQKYTTDSGDSEKSIVIVVFQKKVRLTSENRALVV
jgi:hypothetical protein